MSQRRSMMVRLARYIQALPIKFLQIVEWPFIFFLRKRTDHTPAIFLLAIPRSGSTVTYQCICHGLSVNYLSNTWNLLYQLPLIGGWLSILGSRKHISDFKSQHGFVSGFFGPAEGLAFWKWWLNCGLSDRDCEIEKSSKITRRINYLRNVLQSLAKSGKPFATAYLGHTLMPDRVNLEFPKAILIRLRRDPTANAVSILNAMRKNETQWFSVRPNECEGLEKASPYYRAASQVYWLNRRLDEAQCIKKMLTVHYERLCENPEKEVDRIKAWCNENGIVVHRKLKLPNEFSTKKAYLENDLDVIEIRKAFEQLETKYGRLSVVE